MSNQVEKNDDGNFNYLIFHIMEPYYNINCKNNHLILQDLYQNSSTFVRSTSTTPIKNYQIKAQSVRLDMTFGAFKIFENIESFWILFKGLYRLLIQKKKGDKRKNDKKKKK